MQSKLHAWNNQTGRRVAEDAERKTVQSELVTKYALQASRFATGADLGRDKVMQQKRAMLMKSFISQGHVEMIINAKNKLNAASFIARNDPHFIPDTIPSGHESAFIVALAEELSKPVYN